MFESLLLRELSALDADKPVHVEGESRKIGQLQVPAALIEAMRASECVVLEAGLETRVALLMDEYQHFFDNPAALGAQLDCLVEMHGRDRIAEWKSLAERGEWRALVARLLEEHYDPAYKRSALRNFVRLPDAPVLKVPAADDAAFARLAEEAA
jgi:tRNA 2-selenouridine synthase